MRRKAILLRALALAAGKRNNCKHLFDIHTLDPSDDGAWLRYPEKTGQTPVRSLPRKENGKARTWMDEKSIRKSHGHHIPPAKGMGERALLLLGLLSLLTAADEVRHADDKHRAASDPSEGHTVKAGEREVGALLIDDGEVHLAVSCLGFSISHLDEIRIGTRSRSAARVDHSRIVCRKRSASNGERDAITVGVVISRRRLDLRKDVSTLIKTDNVNLAVCVGRQFGLLAILRLGAIRLDIATIIALLLQRELNAREPLIFIIGAHLGDIDAIGVVISRVLNRGSRSTLIMWVVGIGQRNLIYLGFTNHILELFFDLALIKDLARVELSLVFDSHLRVAVQQDSSVALTLATLEIGEADSG